MPGSRNQDTLGSQDTEYRMTDKTTDKGYITYHNSLHVKEAKVTRARRFGDSDNEDDDDDDTDLLCGPTLGDKMTLTATITTSTAAATSKAKETGIDTATKTGAAITSVDFNSNSPAATATATTTTSLSLPVETGKTTE